MGPSNLPYTDPWIVLGVHRGASRDEVKAAFRRAALVCHPDVDKSPSAAARFADVKAAADMLLKGPPQPPARPHPSAWQPAAAAAAARPNQAAGLWVGLAAAGVAAFAYGAWLTRSAVLRREGEPGAGRTPALAPQRRQLLHALLADKQAQAARRAREQQLGRGAATAAAATGGGTG